MKPFCTKCDMEDGTQYFAHCSICNEEVYVCNLCMPSLDKKYSYYEEQVLEFHKDIHHTSSDIV